jgi:hypothetical protein
MRWTGHVAPTGENASTYSILVRKRKRRRPLGIPGLVRKDNIKMYDKEMGCEDVDWVNMA